MTTTTHEGHAPRCRDRWPMDGRRAMTATTVLDAVVRVSRRNGRSGDAFMSPTDQRDAIERYAAQHGATIADWHDETDSVSGKTIERAGLQAALDRALTGHVDGIIVAKLDRFARSVTGGLSAIGRLEAAGKLLWSAREGVICGDAPANAMETLMRTIWLGLAQWQLQTLTEGWESTRANHIGRGVANHAPYGYRKGEDRRLLPRPGEAEWVPLIFERRADRWSWGRICDWLTAEGARPRRGGGAWSISTVKQLIANRVYLGELRSGEIVNLRAHEPLVTPSQWERANKVGGARKRREAEPYLLTGIIRCASCGCRMFGMTDRRYTNAAGELSIYRQYRCRGRHGAWGTCPAPARVDADEVEALVCDEFRRLFLIGGAIPTDATTEVDAATAALEAADAELESFVTTAAALDTELFAKGVEARTERRDFARLRLSEARSHAVGVALPVGLDDVWDSYGIPERRPYVAAAFAVVAASRGTEPVPDRVRVWVTGTDVPSPLPGVDGWSQLTPIRS